MSPRNLEERVQLSDGGEIVVRAITPTDKGRLLDFFDSLSGQTIRSRFLRLKPSLSEEELAALTEVDFVGHVGIVATSGTGEGESIVGVGRYVVLDDSGGKRAEIALAITDKHQGRGIGVLLIEQLSTIAAAQGIAEFEMYVPSENRGRLQILEDLGRTVSRATDFGIAHIIFRTT